MNAAENLAKGILANYNNQLQSSSIDLPAHVESLLKSLGATTSDSGGKVTYYGSDPITPDPVSYTHLDVYKRQGGNVFATFP